MSFVMSSQTGPAWSTARPCARSGHAPGSGSDHPAGAALDDAVGGLDMLQSVADRALDRVMFVDQFIKSVAGDQARAFHLAHDACHFQAGAEAPHIRAIP